MEIAELVKLATTSGIIRIIVKLSLTPLKFKLTS